MNDTNPLTRAEYSSPAGIVRYWTKDGAWHIARPVPDGHINPGNLLFTGDSYRTFDEAVAALEAGAE